MKRLVFVSCGQSTEAEIRLGSAIKDLIDATEGYEGYFAQEVHELEALRSSIFKALERAHSAVLVMHPRGAVSFGEPKKTLVRGSVWINQELAILAFRAFQEGIDIPILPLKHAAVALEGVTTAIVLNPIVFESDEDCLERVRNWLSLPSTQLSQLGADDVFEEKWSGLPIEAKRMLYCLLREGGLDVRESALRKRYVSTYGVDSNEAARIIMNHRGALYQSAGVVAFRYESGQVPTYSFHPTWKNQLVRRLRAETP